MATTSMVFPTKEEDTLIYKHRCIFCEQYSRLFEIKPCDICGDRGVIEAIVICSECKVAREHLYCMRVYTTEVPQWWRCDECDQDKLVSPRTIDNEPKTQKLPNLMQQTSLVREGQNNNRVPSQFTFKEKWVDKGRTKYLSCDEAVKLSSGSVKLNCSRKEVCSPPRVFQQATGLKVTSPVSERTHIKSPKEERYVKLTLQQPVVLQSFGRKGKATLPACEWTQIKSPERNVKPNLQQPVVQQLFSPKEKATPPTCERKHIKSPERNVKPNLQQPVVQQSFNPKATPPVCERTHIKSPKPNLQQPVVQQSFSPKEKATPPACERTHLKSPKEERNVKPSLQQHIVQQSFSPKEKATPPSCERTHIKSPQGERNIMLNLQQPIVQQSFSPKEKATPPEHERRHIKSPQEIDFESNLQQPAVQQSSGPKEKAVLPSSEIGGTNPEREIKTTKTELLPPQKEADISRHIEVPKVLIKQEKTEAILGCKNYADMEARGSDSAKPNLASGLPVSEMHDPYIPSINSYWKGCFYLPNGPQKFNEAFKAHPPSRIHYKVYETTKKLPENIYFELVLNHDIHMEIFPADRDDIGLYFFPMHKRRSENDISIIDFMWRNNMVMKSNVEGLELFVLSSRVLPSHAQEFEGNYFLWGVFRCPKTTKKVANTSPLMAANRGPCDDVPPGFTRIPLMAANHEPCDDDDDDAPGFKRICKR